MSLSSQELPDFFPELIRAGVKLNACSLHQLEAYGAAFPGGEVGLRFNPGLGSGGTGKTNVGGPDSSFGIWHELLPQAQAIVAKHKLKVRSLLIWINAPLAAILTRCVMQVVRIHTHIGSGSDPAVWQRVSGLSIDLCRKFPDVTTLNLGGGYKVGRMAYEKARARPACLSCDTLAHGMPASLHRALSWRSSARRCATRSWLSLPRPAARCAPPFGRSCSFVPQALILFRRSATQLHLEIEPGTFLLANSCSIVSTVQARARAASSLQRLCSPYPALASSRRIRPPRHRARS
jgi:diaminopimelate decarboxylase